ncbi:MAG: histidinol-phosphate transaminase [Clostridia bacterium]
MEYRKCLEKVLPYVPGKSEEEIKKEFNIDKVIKIASNENPYGPSLKVKECLENINFNIYPDNYVTILREKLAGILNVPHNYLLFGNGSVEIIQMLSRVLLNEGDNIITELPSFSSYFSEAKIQNANIKTIKYDTNYSFNLSEILNLIDDRTKMIYITNPNNPLGTIIKSNELIEFVKQVPKNILVVIDEAYFEFVRDKEYISAIDLTKNYSNVCVLRTFSKAYGLASLRIGYIVANSNIINELEKVRVPFNVSTIAQKCALVALEEKEHLNYVVNNIHNTIDYMYEELDKINIEYIKTQANFIMINVNRSSKEIVLELLKKGYIVRDGFPLMESWIRVSIGTKEEMSGFVNALKEVI